MDRLKRALSENRAETSPAADDPRLRGRTYAIPFERVWAAALALATESRRWTVIRADDQEGVIYAKVRTLVFRFPNDVTIRISLDSQAQTRLDMTSAARKGKGDFGWNARLIGRFLRGLDRRLGGTRDLILDPPLGPRQEPPRGRSPSRPRPFSPPVRRG